MPKATKETKKELEIEKKLEYLGLNLNKIPDILKDYEPLQFRASRGDEEKTYKVYRYVSVKDIQILLTPANRLDPIIEKYKKANPIISYIEPKTEEDIERHTTFIKMLTKMNVSEIEAIDEEQKLLNKKIPFKVKYDNNYLWQIYYSEVSDKYFMLVPTEDSDYSAFFYLLKKQIDRKKGGKIFVPINYVDYSNTYLKKSEFADIANYLWLFTKDWPLVYEVYDKKDVLNIQITGETEVYEKMKSSYKIKLSNRIEASKFYKLLKALFILQTELPNQYEFKTRINKEGSIDFYYYDIEMKYDDLPDFIEEQLVNYKIFKKEAQEEIQTLERELKQYKEEAMLLDLEYLTKEKQIATFLECKKTFFGKVKYYFKYSGKSKTKMKGNTKKESEKVQENNEVLLIDEDLLEEEENKNVKSKKEPNTIEEILKKYKDLNIDLNYIKNMNLDINAQILRIKNLKRKIKNATQYIEEIEKHKKSIFEFWKFTNKDEVAALEEGEEREDTFNKKIKKAFDYEEDFQDLGKTLDKMQRKVLSKEECDSIYIASTNVLEDLNKINKGEETPKDIEASLKNIKKEAESEKQLFNNEEVDIFGGIVQDRTKIKILNNRKHRENPKDKFAILDIVKGTKSLSYKLTLEEILKNIKNSFGKIKLPQELAVYKATTESQFDNKQIDVYNINPENAIKKLGDDVAKINLIRINLKEKTDILAFSNITFYDNRNLTLPTGMHVTDEILLDNSRLDIKLENKSVFRVVVDSKEDGGKTPIKTINVYEYD